MEEAKDTVRKLMFFSVGGCAAIGIILSFAAPFFPMIYNTTEEIRGLAARFIIVSSLCMPLYAFVNVAYFTLRSGGKTLITFFFDSVFVWVVNIPLAYVLSRFTGVNIIPLYFFCQFIDIIKCVIGYVLMKKGVWMNTIIVKSADE